MAILLPGNMNGQDTKTIEPVFHEIRGTKIVLMIDKNIKNTEIFWFNPFTVTLYIVTPDSNTTSDEHKALISKYFRSMKSLKNTPYQSGDLQAVTDLCCSKNDTIIKESFKKEIINKRPESIYTSVYSYNPYKKQFTYKINGFISEDKDEILTGVQEWLNDNFIYENTNGKYKTVKDFQYAFDNGNEDAIKYAKGMQKE